MVCFVCFEGCGLLLWFDFALCDKYNYVERKVFEICMLSGAILMLPFLLICCIFGIKHVEFVFFTWNSSIENLFINDNNEEL